MRKSKPKKRVILPDPMFNDVEVTKFVNNLMLNGKKSAAYEIFYGALQIVEEKKITEELSAVEVWRKALENVTPLVEVRSRRVGGATFQIPSEIRPSRRQSIGMKNLIHFSRKRSGHSMRERLAAEIIAAFNEEGAAYKKKEETHRMAEANKAFSHFRF
ncbi:MAG: 30S ribosomal protein S7 [Bacteroidales bacterium]|jgi:small subunit ribosomal protein S7|nr:30S ribosomal protein S7 [Bacteroidales bacterium]NLK81862.1 30S ribosomal protein S7 [Bacteroidales bacterium]HPY82290.1 30S ribosomal protein S7 [Bacteroidales bacterium]